MKRGRVFAVLMFLLAMAIVAGCATDNGYEGAFSGQTALTGNSRSFRVPVDKAMRAVELTLIQQGFNIEKDDTSAGLIEAKRDLRDNKDTNVTYDVDVTASVVGAASGKSSIVALSASQKTVLHRKWHTWWHLLWLIPIFPTGTEYQTVVTKEGNVTNPAFYKDFFSVVKKEIAAKS